MINVISERFKIETLETLNKILSFDKVKNQIYSYNKFKKIQNTLKNLINKYKYYYSHKASVKKLKCFLKWRNNSSTEKKFISKNLEIESIINKKIENDKKEIEEKSENCEKEINEIKNNLNELYDHNVIKGNKLKQFQEKEASLQNKLKLMEDERKGFEENKKYLEKEIKNSSEELLELENYFKELKDTSTNLTEQLKEKDNNLNIHIKEMNEMLELFEKKSTELTSLSKEYEESYNNNISVNKNTDNIFNGSKSPNSSILKNTIYKVQTFPSNLILKNNSKTNIQNKTNKSNTNQNSNSNSLTRSINIQSQVNPLTNSSVLSNGNKLFLKSLGPTMNSMYK